MRLSIGHNWTGEPLCKADRVELQLNFAAQWLEIAVDARYYGDAAPAVAPGHCPGLWNHEVVELFVAADDGTYTEIELGPHGHHLVLRFAGYRQLIETIETIGFRVSRATGRWSGVARIPNAYLPVRPTRLNAFAIHGAADKRCYLCWSPLPAERPDFHRVDRFPTFTVGDSQ